MSSSFIMRFHKEDLEVSHPPASPPPLTIMCEEKEEEEEDVCPPPMPEEDEQENDHVEEEEEEEEEDDDDDEEDQEKEEEEEEPAASSVFVPTTDCPYLVFHHGKRNSKQTFFSIKEEKYWVTSIIPAAEMRGMVCCASSDGWLVMLDNYSTRCFLLNPVSMEKVELPPMKMSSPYRRTYHCVLTSSPSDNHNCVVMFVSSEHAACLFCRPNDQKWTRKSLGSKSKYGSYNIGCAVVSCKGKIYISFRYGGSIKVLDTTTLMDDDDDDDDTRNNSISTAFMVETIIIEDEKKPMEQKHRFAPGTLFYDLIESCGEVFLVVKIYWGGVGQNMSVYNMEVFKLISSNNNSIEDTTWEKVESLGDDRVFFLGEGCSLSFSASKIGTNEDNIFFLEPGDACVYTYNMKDRSISIDTPCPHIVCPTNQPYWMLPSVV